MDACWSWDSHEPGTAPMTTFAFLVLFAALQNIDNFFMAAAYRWKGLEIRWRSNLVIAALSGLFTEAAFLAANAVKSEILGYRLGEYSEMIGRGILVMIATWTLVGYFRARFFPQWSDSKTGISSGSSGAAMGFREAAVLGVALAADNLGPSFAFGLINPAAPMIGFCLSILIFFISLLSVECGQAAAARFRNGLGKVSPKFAAGCLLLGIALFDPGDTLFAGLRFVGGR